MLRIRPEQPVQRFEPFPQRLRLRFVKPFSERRTPVERDRMRAPKPARELIGYIGIRRVFGKSDRQCGLAQEDRGERLSLFAPARMKPVQRRVVPLPVAFDNRSERFLRVTLHLQAPLIPALERGCRSRR